MVSDVYIVKLCFGISLNRGTNIVVLDNPFSTSVMVLDGKNCSGADKYRRHLFRAYDIGTSTRHLLADNVTYLHAHGSSKGYVIQKIVKKKPNVKMDLFDFSDRNTSLCLIYGHTVYCTYML